MNISIYIGLGTLVLFFLLGIRIVRPVQMGLIETLGKYTETAEQGFHWIIPIIQKMVKVNVTENMVDVTSQKIITKDDLNAEVDAVVYFRVLDLRKAVYEVDDYHDQIVNLAQTTLRNIIGKLTLSEANSKRGQINTELEKELSSQIKGWGLQIVRVEMQRIDPPQRVQESMNDVVIAERKKIASTNIANAVEIEADGMKRADIKKAEGIAQAKKLISQGQATAIQNIHVAANKYFVKNAQKLKHLETMQASLENNSKIILSEKGIKPQLLIGKLPMEGEKNG